MQFPPAILFDLDDTVISFNGPGAELWKEVCQDFCHETEMFQPEQLLSAVRQASHWYWGDRERHRIGRADLAAARRKVVKSAFEDLSVDNMAEAYRLADTFSSKRKDRIALFPKSIETLNALQQKGIRLALVTNGAAKDQHYKIDKFALRPYFEKIFIEGELGFGKPDTRVFMTVLERLRLSPADVWMIGDNLEWDVAAPQQLGIYSVWNDYKQRGLPESSETVPDRIIHHIGELIGS